MHPLRDDVIPDSPDAPLHNRKHLERRRQRLRNAATPVERVLWSMLKGQQLGDRKFRRQHSIGPYTVDFYCPAERLVIELDGATHDDPARHDYDDERQQFLTEKGFTVLRFENKEVFEQSDMVCAAIARHFSDKVMLARLPSSDEEGKRGVV